MKNKKAERMRIVDAAATIIRKDIRTTIYNSSEYPDLMNFTDHLISETSSALLYTIIVKNMKTGSKRIKKMYSHYSRDNICH